MTRINTIDPVNLTDQHLFTEYREITRVNKLAKPLDSYGEYTMGTGHVKFFYDKGMYLTWRMTELKKELDKRNYNYTDIPYTPHPDGLNNWWEPSLHDKQVNLMRLCTKLAEKPDFYKYYGKPVPKGFYLDQLTQGL